MTTLAIILKAKKEIERALEGKSNIISRALDTQEFQASQMGKALALLEVAEDQLREIGPEKGPRPGQNASQNINEQGAAETEATDLPEADEKNPDAPQEEARSYPKKTARRAQRG